MDSMGLYPIVWFLLGILRLDAALECCPELAPPWDISLILWEWSCLYSSMISSYIIYCLLITS
jgi:hypothetical protein